MLLPLPCLFLVQTCGRVNTNKTIFVIPTIRAGWNPGRLLYLWSEAETTYFGDEHPHLDADSSPACYSWNPHFCWKNRHFDPHPLPQSAVSTWDPRQGTRSTWLSAADHPALSFASTDASGICVSYWGSPSHGIHGHGDGHWAPGRVLRLAILNGPNPVMAGMVKQKLPITELWFENDLRWLKCQVCFIFNQFLCPAVARIKVGKVPLVQACREAVGAPSAANLQNEHDEDEDDSSNGIYIYILYYIYIHRKFVVMNIIVLVHLGSILITSSN